MPDNAPEAEVYTLGMLEQLRDDLRLFGNAKHRPLPPFKIAAQVYSRLHEIKT
jgi:hypothetical protein